MPWNNFQDLEIWKKAHYLRTEIWRLSKKYPSEEKYILISQMKRAAHSVCANIAEGHGIYHFLESRHHLYRSRGSAEEVRDCLILSKDLNYITKQKYQQLDNEYLGLIKGINGYIKFIKQQKT